MLLIEDRRPVSVSNISKIRICDSSLNIWQPHKSLIFVLDIYLFMFLFFADCIKHIHDPICYGVRHCSPIYPPPHTPSLALCVFWIVVQLDWWYGHVCGISLHAHIMIYHCRDGISEMPNGMEGDCCVWKRWHVLQETLTKKSLCWFVECFGSLLVLQCWQRFFPSGDTVSE